MLRTLSILHATLAFFDTRDAVLPEEGIAMTDTIEHPTD